MRGASAERLDLFLARPLAVGDPGAYSARALPRLSAREQAEIARFRFDVHRHEHLVAIAMRRAVLSETLGVAPEAVELELGPHGKPDLAPSLQPAGAPVHFNITHAAQLVVLAVHGRPVGVDTEALSRGQEIVGIASTVFTPREIGELLALSGAAQDRRAVSLWTLKEAYLKARGVGLYVDPLLVELAFDGDVPSLSLAPEAGDDARRWTLELREVDAHLVAVAYPSSPPRPRIVLHDWALPW
jgi:4'-phosphopantetheinyl transferase